MKCTKVQDLLKSDYLDTRINQRLRLRLEGHLEKCQNCRALKQRLESQRAALRGIKQKDVPPEIWQNIQSAIIEERLKEEENVFWRSWEGLKRVFFPMPRPAIAFAGAAAVLIFSLVATKAIFNNHQYTVGPIEEDAWAVYRLNGDTYTYNLGTAIEEYFL